MIPKMTKSSIFAASSLFCFCLELYELRYRACLMTQSPRTNRARYQKITKQSSQFWNSSQFSKVEIRKRFLVLAFFEIERQKWCEYDDSEKHEASINLWQSENPLKFGFVWTLTWERTRARDKLLDDIVKDQDLRIVWIQLYALWSPIWYTKHTKCKWKRFQMKFDSSIWPPQKKHIAAIFHCRK